MIDPKAGIIVSYAGRTVLAGLTALCLPDITYAHVARRGGEFPINTQSMGDQRAGR
jgi:hypothetical protein